VTAALTFLVISVLSSQVPDRVFFFLPEGEVLAFLQKLCTNLAHVPLFGGFTFFLLFAVGGALPGLRHRPGPYLLTLGLTVLFGVVDEVHQAFVPGRFPSYLDLLLNAIGGSLACLFASALASRRMRAWTTWSGTAGLLLAAIAVAGLAVVDGTRSTLPFRRAMDFLYPLPDSGLVDGLDSPRGWKGVAPRQARLGQGDFGLTSMRIPTAESGAALRVRLPRADWAGIGTREAPVDLSPFESLTVTVWSDGAPPPRIGLRVVDFDGRDGEVHVPFPREPGTVTLPLASLADQVDLHRVDLLALIVRGHEGEVEMVLDRLTAVRKATGAEKGEGKRSKE
jgi:hypothetical protein